jgi:hypothetical protein
VLKPTKTKMSFAVVGPMIGEGKPAVQWWRLPRRIGPADNVVIIVRRDLLGVEIECIAQQHSQLAIILFID